MPYGCHGRHIVDERILKTVAFVNEAAQSIGTILVVVVIEVVPAHLVYHQSDDKLRSLDLCHGPEGDDAQH